jgi:hypothetical protein
MNKYAEVVKYGLYQSTNLNTNVTCDRCFRNNLIAFLNYKHIDLCLRCVDIVSVHNTYLKPNHDDFLVRMEQKIYNINPYNIYPYNKYCNDTINTITTIVILEQISEDNFSVLLNNKLETMSAKEIARKYFAYLSDNDQEFFRKFLIPPNTKGNF